MYFETEHLYHIYNQGNNKQKIFFGRNNYLFFLKKIRIHILPHCDVLAYCLMPNHFHLLVWVNNTMQPAFSHGDTSSHPVTKPRTLNDSIAILLRSYTRAINKQENRSGCLFREATKAINLTRIEKLTPAYFDTQFGAKINIPITEEQYPQVCFNYIHKNPVKAKIVTQNTEWEYSSALDYAEMRKGTLINKQKACNVGLVW